jgi:hypothetical protein
MDTLCNLARKEEASQQETVQKQFQRQRQEEPDPDLIAPWLQAEKLADREFDEEGIKRKQRDLKKIVEHVEKVRKEWNKRPRGSAFTNLPIERRQDILRMLSRKFASIYSSQDFLYSAPEIARLAASYAYKHDLKGGKPTRFPWDVALRELCHIKAHALGPWKTVTGGFYDRFQLKAGFFDL